MSRRNAAQPRTPPLHHSLKWLGNLTRHHQGDKTAVTLTEIERCLLHREHRRQNLPGLVHKKPLSPARPPSARCKRPSGGVAAAMGTATGAGYFQRGSLFWFTVITVSFGYYTVTPVSRRQAPRERTGQPG